MPSIIWFLLVLVILAVVLPMTGIPERFQRAAWIILGVVFLIALLTWLFGYPSGGRVVVP